MRECGQTTDADDLTHGALADALAEFRVTLADTAVVELEQRVEVMFAAETERVANAAVLAELLAPLVAKQLQAAGAVAPHAAPHESQVAAVADRDSRSSQIDAPPKPARAGAAGIADFIDEMITQERTAPPGRSTRRAT